MQQELNSLEKQKYTKDWNFEVGSFVCVQCRQPVFASFSKLPQPSEFPEFRSCIPGSLDSRVDFSFGMRRYRAICSNCGYYIGHHFEYSSDKDKHYYTALSDSVDFVPGLQTETLERSSSTSDFTPTPEDTTRRILNYSTIAIAIGATGFLLYNHFSGDKSSSS
eukprot:TRINITY_DN11543_c0_g1_i1.p1 TRINITY_DN11543_c0_g1~~TRINITY_DN11543_c0_g1_i1.p1  ORF type:complete len:176 (-),score=38.68 TRINITY_DN11543_c0_g1_i1:91-582(-)